jgi:hypothetical protein
MQPMSGFSNVANFATFTTRDFVSYEIDFRTGIVFETFASGRYSRAIRKSAAELAAK